MKDSFTSIVTLPVTDQLLQVVAILRHISNERLFHGFY